MSNTQSRNITLEDVKMVFRNFSGKESPYNRAGQRNFGILLDEDLAQELIKNRWNVKHLKPREEGDEPQAYLQVSVNFNNRPPKIMLITGQGKTLLDEESISLLDWAEIETTDLIITPYLWEVNGKEGIKAYVKSLYVTIVEDELDRKYYKVPAENMDDFSEDKDF